MFKIERALSGLLGTFKVFSQGSTPRNLLEEVRPTIDLHTYALQNIGVKVYSSAGVNPTLGTMITFTQPRDWLVIGTDAQVVAGAAGDVALLQLDVASEGGYSSTFCMNFQNRGLTAAQWGALAAGDIRHATNYPAFSGAPLWFKAGTIWTLGCGYLVGATSTCSFQILYYEVQSENR